jgi:hypothetical protein
MTVLGLSGFAQSGKTAAAKYLETKGYTRKHTAEPLRAMLAVLLKANGLSSEMITRYLEGDLKEQMIPEIGVTSRVAQITLGTEWGRERVNPDLWADTWARGISADDNVLNDSVRFPNEEAAIRDLDGFTIMIKRPGTKPAKFKWGFIGEKLYDWFGVLWGAHDSERIDRLSPDYVIKNDGTLQDLYDAIDRVVEDWNSGAARRRRLAQASKLKSDINLVLATVR